MMLTEIQDAATTRGVLSTMSLQEGWAGSEVGAYPSRSEILSVKSPFIQNGAALQISSKVMHVNMPYTFQFMEWWFVVVKHEDGELYFYYVGE